MMKNVQNFVHLLITPRQTELAQNQVSKLHSNKFNNQYKVESKTYPLGKSEFFSCLGAQDFNVGLLNLNVSNMIKFDVEFSQKS